MKKINLKNLLHDAAVLIIVLGVCSVLCIILSKVNDDNNPFAVSVFILGVAIISMKSTGFICGVVASALGVLCVNFMFTYPFWELDMTITSYPLTFGVMLIVSVIISTLTTRIKMQQKAIYEAEKEKMRANLLRAVSHDIRTPIAAIVGSTSVLIENEEISEETKKELIYEINKDARWLSRLTENILSVTKFKTEGVKLKLVDEVVEEIVSSAIVKFRKVSDIPIAVNKPDEIITAPMEGILVEQVIINLLENVVHHSPKATKIDVVFAADKNNLSLSVSDNGDGIDESILPHLFDGELITKNDTEKAGKRNMGIGLSVCSTIIKAHGGKMWAENNADGGASVSFSIPLEEVSNEH